MKRSLVLLFLTIMLLCGVLLRAANNSAKIIRVEVKSQPLMQAEIKKDMQLVPNVILL